VSVSVGVASIPSECSSLKEVIALAESALLASKSGGKDRVSVTQSHHDLPALMLASVEEIIRTPSMIGIAKQAILHHPGGALAGHELLFRGPAGSPFEAPPMFFAAARRQNLLAAADLACIRRACETARSFTEPQRIHLNVFPSTLLDTSVDEMVELCRALDGVVLELSEQEFVGDPGLLLPAIAQIKKAGIRIALDDVGFGRSSLETVLVLEPEVIKIDRCLVHGIDHNPALRRTTTRLLKCLEGLGAEVIAEGVETATDAYVLQDLGVRFVQGFLWGRPELMLG
jgi:EAL domain-containing protein (putative c-di-GMP-specific phosphodiesterase class I)